MSEPKIKLDRFNRKIVEELQRNGRITNLELAEKVNLSPSACFKRTKYLEQTGCITRYTADVDLKRMCVSVSIMCNITLSDYLLTRGDRRFEDAIKDEPCVVECFKVGGEIDYIAHFVCADVQQYEAITEKLLNMDVGISRITSHFILSTSKPFDAYPIEELHWPTEDD